MRVLVFTVLLNIFCSIVAFVPQPKIPTNVQHALTPSLKSVQYVSKSSTSKISMMADDRNGALKERSTADPVEIGKSVSAMSQQMKEMRAELEQNEEVKLLMQGLRGSNLNDDATAKEGLEMLVVEVDDDGEALPLRYDPDFLKQYFDQRPAVVYKRLGQIIGNTGPLLTKILIDVATKKSKENEVKRAIEFREIITSLGPFFIKLGQALSIRPDILSPRVMVEMQQLCDKVPSYDSKIAFETIEKELGKPVSEVYSKISPEPIAAASLGQVYRATLRDGGQEVAVKVQRPFVLETVSLDLYLMRELGNRMKQVPFLAERTDLVALIDEFAPRFYDELDYNLECENGIRIQEYMKGVENIIVPTNYPEYTNRRVFTAEWIEGEKLSQSTADDVGTLVNSGVVAYLTQLLESGFFHADPHPGNLIRTPEGKLCLLDFGLMTELTDDQKYGMIEAIAHLIHRDYSQIGEDFKKLDFIPKEVDVEPIVPALTRVFDAALAGGGAKSINFQELAADLAQITFEYPFRIPPYFALVIRAIGVLEGIALVANPKFAIVDEAYPYIAQRLLKDESPRLRAALRYMIYGKDNVFDVERMIDLFQAFESFTETQTIAKGTSTGQVRDALYFIFSEDGRFFRDFILDETVKGVDCLSRDALRQLAAQIGFQGTRVPSLVKAMVPKLSEEEKKVVDNTSKLINFLVNGATVQAGAPVFAFSQLSPRSLSPGSVLQMAQNSPVNRETINELRPVLRELGPQMRDFGLQISLRVSQVAANRFFDHAADNILGPKK